MFNLPTELALTVLAYLPIDSILRLLFVCRQWRDFIQLQEKAIYHQAAVYHKLIPRSISSIEEARIFYSEHSLAGVSDWKDLCKSTQLRRSAQHLTLQQARDVIISNRAGVGKRLRE